MMNEHKKPELSVNKKKKKQIKSKNAEEEKCFARRSPPVHKDEKERERRQVEQKRGEEKHSGEKQNRRRRRRKKQNNDEKIELLRANQRKRMMGFSLSFPTDLLVFNHLDDRKGDKALICPGWDLSRDSMERLERWRRCSGSILVNRDETRR